MEEWFLVYCGSVSTMNMIRNRGVLGLSCKGSRHRWLQVDKDAQYEIVTEYYAESDLVLGELYADRDMRAIAKERGLIL